MFFLASLLMSWILRGQTNKKGCLHSNWGRFVVSLVTLWSDNHLGFLPGGREREWETGKMKSTFVNRLESYHPHLWLFISVFKSISINCREFLNFFTPTGVSEIFPLDSRETIPAMWIWATHGSQSRVLLPGLKQLQAGIRAQAGCWVPFKYRM